MLPSQRTLVGAFCALILATAWTPTTNAAMLDQDPPQADRNKLAKLTEYRSKLRRTIDGRLCAAAFVQDDQTFTNCTITRNPQGETGRSWCYVEVQLLGKGAKDWNYCAPSIDYNSIRNKLGEKIDQKLQQGQKIIELLEATGSKTNDMKLRYEAVCGESHAAIGSRVGDIETLLERGRRVLGKITDSIDRAHALETVIAQVKDDVAAANAKAAKDPRNCSAVFGYDVDPQADGLRADYFANPFLQGPRAHGRTDRQVNFSWNGTAPAPNVSPRKFSVRWTGYLAAPETATFNFFLESDCGGRIWLNDHLILVDRMPDTLPSADMVPVLSTRGKAGTRQVPSKPQQLVGGHKYKLVVEMIHANFMKHIDPLKSLIKLFWRSSGLSMEVIPPSAFFSTNPTIPVRVSGLSARDFGLSYLIDGLAAFKNSDSWFFSDIPSQHYRRRVIISAETPTADKFTVVLSGPAKLYIASPMNQPLPVGAGEESPWKARELNEVMSVVRSGPNTRTSTQSRIYQMRVIPMPHGGQVPMEVLQRDIPFIMFVEPLALANAACGGTPEVVSLPGSKTFSSCKASSKASDEFDCHYGLNGKLFDQKFGTWRTKPGTSAGESITLRFATPINLLSFHYKPLDDPSTWPSVITLYYSATDTDQLQRFNILHTNNVDQHHYELGLPVITDYLKVELTQLYVSSEMSGGSFEFVGTPCSLPHSENQGELPRKIQIEDCGSSLMMLEPSAMWQQSQKTLIQCQKKCIDSPEGHVYGAGGTYAPESTLCTAAIAAGLCKRGESCAFTLTLGGARSSFEAHLEHQIQTLAHGPSDVSVMLSKPPCNVPQKPNWEKIQVVFKSAKDGPPPQGFRIDSGEVKTEHNGLVYGWLREAPAITCKQPRVNPMHTGGVIFPLVPTHPNCKNKEDCTHNFWSVTVPDNSYYIVQVQLGSSCRPSTNEKIKQNLQVNGFPLIDDYALTAGQSVWAIATVKAANNTIMLTGHCHNKDEGCNNSQTIIQAVTIRRIGPDGAPPQVALPNAPVHTLA